MDESAPGIDRLEANIVVNWNCCNAKPKGIVRRLYAFEVIFEFSGPIVEAPLHAFCAARQIECHVLNFAHAHGFHTGRTV